MLNIRVKFVAKELTPELENGYYEAPEGVTVRELITICEKQCGSVVPEENFKLMYPLFNGKPVRLETPLTVDGILHLCRIVMGG